MKYNAKILLLILLTVIISNCNNEKVNKQPNTESAMNISISINGGASSTTSRSVTVTITAKGIVAVEGYYLSESSTTPSDSDNGWVDITPTSNYSGDISYELSGGYGTKTVYVWFKDASLNIYPVASSAIDHVFVSKEVDKQPNIILIVVDTLRADHMSTAGYERDTTPNIASFAQQSVVFTNAIAPAPWTLPSYASILSSKHAFNHNMNLPPTISGETDVNVTMLPKKIKDVGYQTVSIQTNAFTQYVVKDFDEKYYYLNDSVYYQDAEAIDKALEWLGTDTNTNKNFFMFTGLYSPHWEYKTNNSYLEGFVMDDIYQFQTPVLVTITGGADEAIVYSDLSPTLQRVLGDPQSSLGYYQDSRLYISAYDADIKYSDYQIGRLLYELKNRNLFDDAIIIITADHGENMVDHASYFNHSDNLFNSLLHVPLLIKFPKQTSQRIISNYVRTIDILPSVFEYLSLDIGSVDGKSLLPIINNLDVDYSERPLISYLENISSREQLVSLIMDGYKLIKYHSSDELYNLSLDPSEQNNLASQESEKVNSLKSALSTFYKY